MISQESFVKFSLASGVTFALLVGMGAAATAQDATVVGKRPIDQVPTERVSYSDLNLASAAGEKTLIIRVRGAVRRVCDGHVSTHPYIACRSFAWRGAKPQIDRAVARAREMALNGTSDIPPVAILIATPQ